MTSHWDRVGFTVQEILSTRNEYIDQLAAAYSKVSNVPADKAVLVMSYTDMGVAFSFELKDEYQVKN